MVDLENRFPDHPLSTLKFAGFLQDAGFTITAGEGREYYLIIATKESGDRKVIVNLDDEFNVDAYCFSPKDSDRPAHTARFPKLNESFHAGVISYINRLAV